MSFFIALPLCFQSLLAQTDTVSAPANLPVDRQDNFQFLIQRGILLPLPEEQAAAPLDNSASGTLLIGGSVKLNLIRNVVGLRVASGVSWYKLNYSQETGKLFPTDSSGFLVEKHRFTYLSGMGGLYFNITKDEDGDAKLFLEAGFMGDYKLNSTYKVKTREGGQVSKNKVEDLPNITQWRYGAYGRLGYKRWALVGSYIFSDTFTKLLPNGKTAELESLEFPPRLELGLSFFL